MVAYSLAYPAAVAAMLVLLNLLLERRLPLPARLEPPRSPPRAERIVNWTVDVTRDGHPTLAELRHRYPGLGFSRLEHDGVVNVATDALRLAPGDAVVALGPERTVAAFCGDVGQRSDRHLPLDRGALDFRRIVVSNRRLAGQRLVDLDLPSRYGVTVTRVRRGDDDLVAHDGFEIELGDRVRVVGPSDQLGAVARLFGDSERHVAELDAVGFALESSPGWRSAPSRCRSAVGWRSSSAPAAARWSPGSCSVSRRAPVRSPGRSRTAPTSSCASSAS